MDEDWIQPARIILCIFLFAVLAAFNLGVACRLPPTGDEPHYLTTAHSIAYDHDLSLLNNYRDKDYRAFYPGDLPKRTTPSADGKRELPAEGLGLPFLLAPVYRLAREILPAGLLVPSLRLFMCSITSIVLYLLLAAAGVLGATGMLRCAAPFLVSPLLFYSGQFYPEIPAALLVAASLLLLAQLEEHPFRGLLLLSLVPGALVWMHPKYLALALSLLVGSAAYCLRTFRVYGKAGAIFRAVLLALAGAAGVFSFLLFLHSEYGGWSPNRIYAGWEPQQQKTLLDLVLQEGFGRITVMFRMFFGFWMDQRFGILVYAPLYVAFFPAVLSNLRRRSPLAGLTAALFAIHFLGLCWGAPLGGFAPPSRHFVVLVPLLLLAILFVYDMWTPLQRAFYWGLLGLSGVISLAMAARYRSLFSDLTWRNPDQHSVFWQQTSLDSWIPCLTATQFPLLLVLLWTALIGALSWLLVPRSPVAQQE